MVKVALITGGNGITGSAIAEYLARQTTKEQWRKIIVTSRSSARLPLDDPRFSFVELDFTKPIEELITVMEKTCSDTTHAFFSSYVHKDSFEELASVNCALFENFLTALEHTAPALENITLQTGGKHYNLHLQPVQTPLKEEDVLARSGSGNFYHAQEVLLVAKQRHAKWSFNVIRPQAIIGVAYGPNGMSSALCFAVYFTVCSYLDVEAKMLTNERNWAGAEDCSSSKLIADLSVFAATSPKCANQVFNATNGDHFLWRYMWPRLAAFFGAHASPDQTFSKAASYATTKPGELLQEVSFVEWAKDKRIVWREICDARSAPQARATFDSATWAYQDWVFRRTWTSSLSMNKARKFGWTGWADTFESFVETFLAFEQMGLIPRRVVPNEQRLTAAQF
jgi:nucleoside-diphosphate-sugar epimerase